MATILYWRCLPSPLFTDPVSTVVVDKNGELLGAKIANDGQWRFPYNKEVPTKFVQAITTFEDKRFYGHPGVDILAIGRALVKNVQHQSVVSGGSTLSMQVIRVSRKGKPRTVKEKLIEMALATRLELAYTKDEILALYASNAPFGGNVVGLDAAAWRYYGRSAADLGWAEMVTLAVLPNSPALIHPGRNRDQLKAKRDRLLERLVDNGVLDSIDAQLAMLEDLPQAPKPLPDLAPHLVAKEYLAQKDQPQYNKQLVATTINAGMQQTVNTLDRKSTRLNSSHYS